MGMLKYYDTVSGTWEPLAQGPKGETGDTGDTGPVGPSAVPATFTTTGTVFKERFNVIEYGALGDGVTDDGPAIQAALDAARNMGGGIVYLPAAIYRITTALIPYSSVTIQGSGMESTLIKQATLNADGIRGDGLSSLILRDFGLVGNGTGDTKGTGTGKGIHLTYGSNGNNPFHIMSNIMVRNWGSDGVYTQTMIVSTMNKVYSAFNGGHGFNMPEGGTSVNWQNCWARQNAQAGYRFFTSVYQSLTGCAADNNGIAYLVDGCQNIGFYSCGAENQLKADATYNGYGWKINNSSVITIDGWVTGNISDAIWVTGGSNAVAIRSSDNSPGVGATSFIKTDSGTNATIYEMHNTTANILAAGTYTLINPGDGSVRATDLYSLNQTASTVPYFNVNKALVSSAVTPTELGYLTGVTSAIQGQIDGKSATSHTHTASQVTDFDTEVSNNTDVAANTSARHTHANAVALAAVSGTNTGDETQATIKTKLGAATASADGYATATQITKLDGIATSANNYTHPATHSADIITDGTTNKAYTATEKTKLAGIATGAEVNVNADWNAVSGDALISNKPTLGTAAAKNIPATGNASATEVVYGSDTRLSDARTPTTHAHVVGDITATGTPSSTTFLRGDGTWTAPSGGSAMAVARQNNTTNSTISTPRIETGWGVFAQGAASNKSETVTFGTAFTTTPIVMISSGGDQTGGTIALGNGDNIEKGPFTIKAYGESTTGFTAHAHTSDGTSWSSTADVYYKWYAIGQ